MLQAIAKDSNKIIFKDVDAVPDFEQVFDFEQVPIKLEPTTAQITEKNQCLHICDVKLKVCDAGQYFALMPYINNFYVSRRCMPCQVGRFSSNKPNQTKVHWDIDKHMLIAVINFNNFCFVGIQMCRLQSVTQWL